MILPDWFDHPEERFSYDFLIKKVQLKRFWPPVKNSFPSAVKAMKHLNLAFQVFWVTGPLMYFLLISYVNDCNNYM